MHSFVQNIGRTALNFLAAFGRITLFSVTAVRLDFHAALLLATVASPNH